MRTTDLNSAFIGRAWHARAGHWIESIGVAAGRAAPALAAMLVLALAIAGCSGESPDVLMASAKDHLARGEAREAVIQLKNVLQQDPDSAEARFLLGKTLFESDDPAGAEVELRRARSLGYSEDLVVPLLARAMVEQGQLKAVADELADVRLSDPKAEADLQVALATAYAGRKLQELADNAIRAALNLQPRHSRALTLQASSLVDRGDLDGAMKALDAAIEANPDEDAAWTLRGTVLLASRGDVDAALDAYRKAIAINVRNVGAHNGALTILVARNDPVQLKAQLEMLAKALPKHHLTTYFQAHVAYMERDFAAARQLLQPVVAAMPDDRRVLLLAGATELQAGSLLQAETYLVKAVQADPGAALPRRLLVMTYLRSGQAEKALAAVKPALAVTSPDPRMVALAAEAYLLSGDLKRAEELFGHAAKLNPRDVRSRTAVALSEVNRGNPGAGFQQLEALAAEDKGATADLALISAHLRRQEFAAALKSVDGLEKKLPGKPLPYFLRGRVQVAMKKPEEARKSFEQAIATDPVYVPAAAALAALDVADGKTDAARQRFRSVLDKDPKNVLSLLGLAELAARSGGGKDDVARLLNQAIEADPQQPRSRLLLVDYLVRQRDVRGALAAAQAGVAAIPTSWQLIDALGRVQLLSGDANQAIASFTKVAGVQPHSAMPQLRLAEAYRANDDPVAARQALGKALLLKPDLLPAQQQLIALDLSAQKPQQALAVARTVQKQRPTQPMGWALEAEIQSRQKDFGAAEAAMRAALSRDPGNGGLAAALHEVLVRAGKRADADRLAASWVKEHPKDSQFMAQLGAAAIARQDYANGEQLLKRALEQRPEDPLVLNNLAWVLAQEGRPGAVAIAEQANAKAPDQPALMDTLALALASEGQFDRAIELQKKVLSLEPKAAAYRLSLAKIYIKAGRKADAEAELDELTKLGDKFGGQAEVAQLLKSLKG